MMESSSSSLDSNLRFDLYAVLVALGLAAFLAVCFWLLYRLTVSARPQDMMPTTADAGAAGPKGALRQQDVAALPVFVVRAGACAAAPPPVECAVCLAEIGDGERGLLLPACGHRFHVACILRWFRAHSTCPLCRAAAVAVGQQRGAADQTCKAGSAQEQVAVVVQS